MTSIGRKRERRVALAVGLALCILQARSHAATKVAVVATAEGGSWCGFLASQGYDCTTFPSTGPTSSLDLFQVVIVLSDEWGDPTHSLANFIETGKGVITRGDAPFALGLDSDPIVQAWIGANQNVAGLQKLLVGEEDSIFGGMPVGTEIGNCGASVCEALGGWESHPGARALARWEKGQGPPGILWNFWNGGQAVFFYRGFTPGVEPETQIILRTLERLTRPIPTTSTWGVACLVLALLISATIIMRNRIFVRIISGSAICVLLMMTFTGRVLGQGADHQVIVRSTAGTTELWLNEMEGPPFHATTRSVANARCIEVPQSTVVIPLWDEIDNDGVIFPHYAISVDGQAISQVTETSYDLKLRYASFDPAVSPPAVDSALLADEESDQYLVQFFTRPLPEFKSLIEIEEASIEAFIAGNTYVIKKAGNLDSISALPFVRAVVPLHPAYKLEDEVLTDLATATNREKLYSIMLWDRGEAEQHTVVERVHELGGCVRRIVPEQHHIIATLSLDSIPEVAKLSSVAFIDVPGEIRPAVSVAREFSGANYVESVGGFYGTGVRGEVMDSGLQIEPFHLDFQNHSPILHGVNGTDSLHGTNVFGIIFGDGTGQAIARGILPAAQGIFASWDDFDNSVPVDCDPFVRGGRYAHIAELVDPAAPYKAVFQNNSWGHFDKSGYTIVSAEMDDILFWLDILSCQAQGNVGHVTGTKAAPEAWAKNALSVGGMVHHNNTDHSEHDWCLSNDNCFRDFCPSHGPAADGRVKPDLIHFSDCRVRTTEQYSAECPNPCYIGFFSGTSAATPITCGYAGLVFQMWHEQVFDVWNGTTSVPTGGLSSVFASRPHATTVKAMLINTAYRYPLVTEPPHYRPDFTRDNMGWGVVDVAALYEQRNNMFIVNETDLLSDLGTKIYTYTVASGSPALRVTLVYSDPPAPPCSGLHLVNDLSLKVVSPSGTTYWGNLGLVNCPGCTVDYFVGNWSISSTASTSFDHINNVENVFIKNPAAGNWTITVIADAIIPGKDGHVETPQDDADFALVISSAERPRGRCCTTSCTPSYHCDCSWTSKSACTGAGKTWSSEETCANVCGSACPDICLE